MLFHSIHHVFIRAESYHRGVHQRYSQSIVEIVEKHFPTLICDSLWCALNTSLFPGIDKGVHFVLLRLSLLPLLAQRRSKLIPGESIDLMLYRRRVGRRLLQVDKQLYF